LEEPLEGRILYKGRPLAAFSPPAIRRSILYIQQKPTLIDGSIKNNLMLPFQFKGNQDLAQPHEERLLELLRTFGLEDLSLSHQAQALSLGQQQRLCFIRGLLLSPEVLLLDEPASALDEKSAEVVEQTAQNLCCDLGLTIIMVSHKKIGLGRIKPINLRMEKGTLKKD
jgi:putative ABC transport system ATP-binding protein